jgi:hypothetical protein
VLLTVSLVAALVVTMLQDFIDQPGCETYSLLMDLPEAWVWVVRQFPRRCQVLTGGELADVAALRADT